MISFAKKLRFLSLSLSFSPFRNVRSPADRCISRSFFHKFWTALPLGRHSGHLPYRQGWIGQADERAGEHARFVRISGMGRGGYRQHTFPEPGPFGTRHNGSKHILFPGPDRRLRRYVSSGDLDHIRCSRLDHRSAGIRQQLRTGNCGVRLHR